MANTKYIEFAYGIASDSLYLVCQQFDVYGVPTGKWLDDTDGTFSNSPSDYEVDMTESGVVPGLYYLSEDRTAWDDGIYGFYIYNSEDELIGSAYLLVINDLTYSIAKDMNSLRNSVVDYFSEWVRIISNIGGYRGG